MRLAALILMYKLLFRSPDETNIVHMLLLSGEGVNRNSTWYRIIIIHQQYNNCHCCS